ncbi:MULTISPECIES: hypothetical protein [unclassified Okeania]|nr:MULTISPECIES: hypothetical protein [unclassified Okeania]NET30058.1 hypothetical protein [Okeania sp. SIO1I7]NET45373.1 hypothetical protein [Okeania sp. SIO2B3]
MANGGILWLVLGEKKGEIEWPKWLPHNYRELCGKTENNNEEIDADIIF